MTMSIKAHFDGKAIVPDEPVNLPINQPLRIEVDVAAGEPRGMTGEEIARSGFAGLWKDRGDIGDTLEFARDLRRRAELRGGGR
jgi:hypothetical protein